MRESGKLMKDVVLGALWTVPDCPDSSETERACRSCEARVVSEAVLEHLIKVEEERWGAGTPMGATPIYEAVERQQTRKAKTPERGFMIAVVLLTAVTIVMLLTA